MKQIGGDSELKIRGEGQPKLYIVLQHKRNELAEVFDIRFFLYNDNDSRALPGHETVVQGLAYGFSPFLGVVKLDGMGIGETIDAGAVRQPVFCNAMMV